MCMDLLSTQGSIFATNQALASTGKSYRHTESTHSMEKSLQLLGIPKKHDY